MSATITITQAQPVVEVLHLTLALAPDTVESLVKLMSSSGLFEGSLKISLDMWYADFTTRHKNISSNSHDALSASGDLCFLFVNVILEACKIYNDESNKKQLGAIVKRFKALLKFNLPPQYTVDVFIKKYIESIHRKKAFIEQQEKVTQLFKSCLEALYATYDKLNQEMAKNFEAWKIRLLSWNDQQKFMNEEMQRKLNEISQELAKTTKENGTVATEVKATLDALTLQMKACEETFKKAQSIKKIG